MTVIPWLAILVATVASFILGALWYSPLLFAKPWMQELGLDPATCNNKKPPVGILFTTFLLTLLSVSILSFCLTPKPGLLYGAVAGLVVGVAWVTPSIGTNLLFEGRSFKFFCITAGFHIVRFLLAGSILGLMQ